MSNSNFEELDSMMGFDPSNLNIFAEAKSSSRNNNIYKTSPSASKTDDGHYHSKIRLLYNPFDRKRSIVHSAIYNIHDEDGWLDVRSSLGDAEDPNSPYFSTAKSCPIFKMWKKFRYSEDPTKEQWARDMFQKNEGDYILVQVMDDKNQPEFVGRILPWKLPQAVSAKLQAKLNPSKDSGKAPVKVLDYLIGHILDVDVTPGPKDDKHPERYYRETKYDLCEFDTDVTPIMKIDGTPLFTEDEIATIEKYDEKLTKISKMKSPEEQASSYELLKKNTLYTTTVELMKRAVDYLKENAANLVEEIAYKPWDEETTKRVNAWLTCIGNMVDPAGDGPKPDGSDIDAMFQKPVAAATPVAPSLDPMEDVMGVEKTEDDDLPF